MKRLNVKQALLTWQMLAIIIPVTVAGAAIVYFSHAATSPSGQAMPTGDLNGWKLIYSDDFLTDVPVGGFSGCSSSTRSCSGLPAGVRSKWWAYPDGWPDTSHNGTYMASKTLSISGGVMNKHIYTDSTGKHLVAAPLPILPGVSGSKGGQLYGRYAIRFRSDSIAHYKTAWLLWPDSEVWPRDGEIDFPEGNLNSTIGAFLHHQGGTSGHDQDGYKSTATYTSWHTAVTEWTPTSVKFILDGVVIGTSTSRIPNTPMHWVVQTETNLDGVVPSASDQGNLQIDWAAAWAYSPGTVASSPSPSTPPITTTPPTTTSPSPSPGTTVINDATVGTGLNQFNFSGAWTAGSGILGSYMEDNHYSFVTGSYYQVQFTGTQAKIYTEKNSNMGIVGISIDGGAETMVDAYAASRLEQQLLYTTPTLSNATHTLKVRITGNKNAASINTYATADRIDVTGGTTSPTPVVVLGDLNNDGKVNTFDLSILLSHWGTNLSGDINKDGRVDVLDLSSLLSRWTG